MSSYVRFSETIENTHEIRNFYIPVDGNEEDLGAFKCKINKFEDEFNFGRGWSRYSLDLKKFYDQNYVGKEVKDAKDYQEKYGEEFASDVKFEGRFDFIRRFKIFANVLAINDATKFFEANPNEWAKFFVSAKKKRGEETTFALVTFQGTFPSSFSKKKYFRWYAIGSRRDRKRIRSRKIRPNPRRF